MFELIEMFLSSKITETVKMQEEGSSQLDGSKTYTSFRIFRWNSQTVIHNK